MSFGWYICPKTPVVTYLEKVYGATAHRPPSSGLQALDSGAPTLEQFASERGFPLYVLNVAWNMYSGQRRILIQGVFNDAMHVTSGLPPGCGLAVDLLHAFLVRTLRSAGRQIEVRQPSKIVVVCNGTRAKHKLWQVWRAGRLKLTTRDSGVDTQWASWRSPAEEMKSFHSVGLYGAEVGGVTAHGMSDLHTSARRALSKGASLRRSAPFELMAHGGPTGDPQVSADVSTVRVWNRRLLAGQERRKSGLLATAQQAPACVRLHGFLPAPAPLPLPTHEAALVLRQGVDAVWVWASQLQPPLQKMWGWKSAVLAGLLATAKEWSRLFKRYIKGQRRPRILKNEADLSSPLIPSCAGVKRTHRSKPSLMAVSPWRTSEAGIQEADVVVNLGAAEHEVHEPSADWLRWELVAKAVRQFWFSGRTEALC
eukprot:5541556-Amphidinium_carterae.1